MADITCKFGGTSLADADCIRRAVDIIKSNPQRRFIVPSAPGKRFPEDKKITDLLLMWHGLSQQDLDPSEPAGIIRDRFSELASALGLEFDVQKHLDEVTEQVSHHAEPDFMASRGEYLNGRLMAELLGAAFVDPAECIKFDYEGELDPVTYELLGERLRGAGGRLQGAGRFVIPGFYGSLPDGKVKTFSRGGSDVTGAIVARASHSRLYENWTDVSGFCMADPAIVPHARRIEAITYAELRELSYMGAKVLHDEAIFPVREPGIPINIRNANDPDNPGTMIVSKRQSSRPVVGIAGLKGFTMINIEKALMNKEVGFGHRVLSVLLDHGISFEHMPTGIDTISLILRDEELDPHGESVLRGIEQRCNPDRVKLQPGLALIATVGQDMNHHIGVAGRLCTALAEANVNLRVIDQGSSEMNIIVGVEQEDLERAVRAIYDAFEAWE